MTIKSTLKKESATYFKSLPSSIENFSKVQSDKIIVYDTTLRDGNQAFAVNFSIDDKIKISRKLDELGIHYIEGGWPNPTIPKETEFFKKIKHEGLNAKIAAFGMTRRPNVKLEDDLNLHALLKAEPECITIFGKSWKLHVKQILETTTEENLNMIFETVKYIKSHGYEVIFDAEHFFDGYKDDPKYATRTIKAADDAGADQIVLCDTRGNSLPIEIFINTKKTAQKFKKNIGIHAHNDKGLATANSIFAILAGAKHVQGTINGIGERCGNTDLVEVLGNLNSSLKVDLDLNLTALTKVSDYVYEIAGLNSNDHQPFVGKHAFTHKGGIHGHAVLKRPEAYESLDPSTFGRIRSIPVSSQAGRTSLLAKAKDLGYELDKNDPVLKRILEKVKDLEGEGYHFENADASLDLLIARSLGMNLDFFVLKNWKAMVIRMGKKVVSEGTVKLKVNGGELLTASEGNGPVNAFDLAFKKALSSKYPELLNVKLAGYRVREVNVERGTAAKVRVFIEFEAEDKRWSTVGVSTNILKASEEALKDGYLYYLHKIRVINK